MDLAEVMIRNLMDSEAGGFFDRTDDGTEIGKLAEPMKVLMDDCTPSGNAVAAEVFLRLHRLTGETRYREIAASTLKALSGGHRTYGYLAAAYAKTVDLYLNGLTDE